MAADTVSGEALAAGGSAAVATTVATSQNAAQAVAIMLSNACDSIATLPLTSGLFVSSRPDCPVPIVSRGLR